MMTSATKPERKRLDWFAHACADRAESQITLAFETGSRAQIARRMRRHRHSAPKRLDRRPKQRQHAGERILLGKFRLKGMTQKSRALGARPQHGGTASYDTVLGSAQHREHPISNTGPAQRVTRRVFLGGMLAAGCSRLLVEDLPEHDILLPPISTPHVLKIVIFEINGLGLPFHTGMIIHTPETRLIFDPLGEWESDQCRRDGEIIRETTPEIEAQYLARAGLATEELGWTLHLFEIEVAPDVATRAIALVEASRPVLPLHCAKEVSTLLAALPGFEFVEPNVVTADLYRTLRARPDFRYTRRAIN
jgi:hypothetical protein